MDAILDFLADYYIYFMIAAGLLLVALIGFIVDGKKKKNKGEEVPAATVDMNQANAMAAAPVVPTQPVQPTEPEPALVFEQPSLNDNETMKEISEISGEPSLTFENPVVEESAPVDFNQPSQDVQQETVTIGEPIEAPALGQTPVIGDEPVVDLPIVETPGVDLPIVEEKVEEVVPIMEIPAVEVAPVVEVPSVEEPSVVTPAVETPVVEVPAPVVETPAVAPTVEIPTPVAPTQTDTTNNTPIV